MDRFVDDSGVVVETSSEGHVEAELYRQVNLLHLHWRIYLVENLVDFEVLK